jgi:hypothetical protein
MRSPTATLWVTLVALVGRLLLLAFQPGLTYDGTYYLRQAERLLRLEYEVVGFPPGYPALIALGNLLTRDPILAGRLVSLVAGVASVALFHAWSRRVLAAPLAFGAALVLALHPHLARTNVEVLSESVYLLLVLGAVVLLETRRHVVAGLLLGFAFLCRPEAVLLLFGFTIVMSVQKKRIPWRFLLAGLVLVAAYAAWASVTLGHPVLSPKQGQLDLGGDLLGRVGTTFWTLHAVFPLLLLPGAIWFGVRSRPDLLIPLLYLLLLPWYDIHIQERMHLPALPFLLLLGVAWAATLPRRATRGVLAMASVLLLVGVLPGARHLGAPGIVTPYAREIGASLRPFLEFDDRVAGRFPFVSYYAGAGFVRQPLVAYSALVDSLLIWEVTHLIVLENEMENISPQLRPLFDDAAFVAAESRLQALAWVAERPGSRAILYQVQEAPISPHSTHVVRNDVTGAAWMEDALLVSTSRGRLEFIATAALDARPPTSSWRDLGFEGAREPSVSEDGRRILLVAREMGADVVVEYEPQSQTRTPFHVTASDRPSNPIFVGDHILYVRQEPPRSLRVLDPKSSRVRAARLEELDPGTATPIAIVGRGSSVAITYVPGRLEHEAQRVIATATWPDVDLASVPERGVVEMPGRWATQLTLADDAICWSPDGDRVLAMVGVRQLDDSGVTTHLEPSLAVVQANGRYRRLAFGFDSLRAPAMRGFRLALLSGSATLHTTQLDASVFKIPEVRVFQRLR